jgi:hypothetical protein
MLTFAAGLFVGVTCKELILMVYRKLHTKADEAVKKL